MPKVRGAIDALLRCFSHVMARAKLGELAPIAADLSEFTFGFATAIFQKYISDKDLVMYLVAKIDHAPDIGTLRLPFYVETPGLRNE